MMTRLSLVCHGTTRDLRSATFGGDDSLDDVGRAAAERLAGVLGQVDHCLTSPAQRARETAAALGLTPTVDIRLRDCDFGRWNGLRFQQVLLKEPRKLVSWLKHPDRAPHGGESIPDVLRRVTAWMQDPARSRGHTVAVTHAAVIRAAVVYVIEAQLQSFWRIDVVPMAKVDLRTNGRRWVLRSIGPLAMSADTG